MGRDETSDSRDVLPLGGRSTVAALLALHKDVLLLIRGLLLEHQLSDDIDLKRRPGTHSSPCCAATVPRAAGCSVDPAAIVDGLVLSSFYQRSCAAHDPDRRSAGT